MSSRKCLFQSRTLLRNLLAWNCLKSRKQKVARGVKGMFGTGGLWDILIAGERETKSDLLLASPGQTCCKQRMCIATAINCIKSSGSGESKMQGFRRFLHAVKAGLHRSQRKVRLRYAQSSPSGPLDRSADQLGYVEVKEKYEPRHLLSLHRGSYDRSVKETHPCLWWQKVPGGGLSL